MMDKFESIRKAVGRIKAADMARAGLAMVVAGTLAIIVFYATGAYKSDNNIFVFIPPVLIIGGIVTFVLGLKREGRY